MAVRRMSPHASAVLPIVVCRTNASVTKLTAGIVNCVSRSNHIGYASLAATVAVIRFNGISQRKAL